MMSRAWYVTCDFCGDPAQISTESAKGARAIARHEGFKRHDRRDICGRCLEDVKREERETCQK